VSADDWLGNHIENPTRWSFQMDRVPPVVLRPTWSCGETLLSRAPVFTFLVRDDLSGLDSNIIVRVNGRAFDITSPALYWNGDTLIFDTGIAGYLFSGGDSVNICIRAADIPDYCEPNITDTCCVVYILPGGPVPQVVRPLNGTYSSCSDEHIVFILRDEDGVVDTSIMFRVIRGSGARDTFRLDIFEPGVSFVTGETIYYSPPIPFEDSETVYVSIDYAEDFLGNPIISRPSWRFIMDRSSPVVLSTSPANGSYVDARSPLICVGLIDSLSGILPESLIIYIDSIPYRYGEPNITYSSGLLCANTDGLGLSWSGGDTVAVCVHAIDRPDYCEPNPLDTCFFFIISPGGPVARILMPLPDSVSACEDQEIWMVITDTNGVDTSTIRIEIMGQIYDISSSELTFRSDTLYWIPDTNWSYEGWVQVSLLSASDNLGNPLSGAPIEWRFMLDLTGPYSVYAYPSYDTSTYDWQN
ncbi:MAG: hypothetical protein ACPL6C_03770, partial [bacterium]